MQENNSDTSLEKASLEQKPIEKEQDINEVDQESEVIDFDKKHLYKKAKKLKKCIKCMVPCNEKVEMYKRAADKFSVLTGYERSDELAERCYELAEKTNKKIRKSIYEKAVELKNSAKVTQDYKSAAKEFRKISGYRDADMLADECDQFITKLENKAAVIRLTKIGAIVLGIIILLVGANTSHAKYYLANTYMMTGSYPSAIQIYKKLGPYKDCKDRLADSRYKNGLKLEAAKDFINAKKSFALAGDYKDSAVKKVEMEKKVLQNSKVGDKVWVGKYEWTILAIKNNQALLLKKKARPGIAYNEESSDTTWEKSTLRSYLNNDFLMEAFSKEEQSNIALTDVQNDDNTVYGIDGGNNTKDYVFLLSISEVKEYQSLMTKKIKKAGSKKVVQKSYFPKIKSNSWLRSPGNSTSSAAFLSENGKVMDYGYVTTSDQMSVLPVIWFEIK